MEWKPATVEEVKQIIKNHLANCDQEELETFRTYGVQPYSAPILRYGRLENVVVIARRGEQVIYWEDVEEGFNVSPIGEDGRVLEHWCNQNELRFALNSWIKGRSGPTKLRPAIPVE
jgi:hypothetical protein